MRSSFLLALAPMTLLAACGGSETEATTDTATQDAGSEPAEQASSEEVATASATPDAATPDAATPDAAMQKVSTPEVAETAKPQAEAKATAAAPAAKMVSAAAAAPVAPPPSFMQCKVCHAVEPGKNGVGPTLSGIVGSKAGEVAGYNFSPALAKSGITWNRSTLDTWLAGPLKMVPGTKMVISQPDAAKRKEIIDYLETLK
ncbi:cytochrome c family protein [Novosphingobium sp. KN65.2]|uniref:c-type cytochrome n=1 Tax=Novosphingobium sp. KN65.2 TaxID=1478134 RepID=UPI0005DC90AA|nr:c-type cytochrome [Novosphingobium sp. KN65.2]CDO37507.1 Cytochrome c, class I [Novosphingobium sp. KN65.2]